MAGVLKNGGYKLTLIAYIPSATHKAPLS